MIPEKNFVISDADFVDWLTEAMGGYAIPPFLKEYKEGKSYLYMGVDFGRDTFRMVANEVSLGHDGGYVLLDKPKDKLTKKENKFIDTHNLEIIEEELENFLKEL